MKFAEHLFDEVLEKVPHKHVVFTIPKRLRAYLRYDRRLYTLFCRAGWQSIKETLSCYSGTPALVLNVQTAGEALNFHPHLHELCASGVFMEDGSFHSQEIDQEALTRHFENYLLSAFVAKELITDEVVREILYQSHSGFNVWVGEPFTDKESSLFVARYVERGPLSLEKLRIQDDIISYTTTGGTAHKFDALEFLALLSSHVPRPYESVTRYYGRYSSRARGERMKRESAASPEIPPEPKRSPSLTWRECFKRIYEIDPLECPWCKGTMRIVSFIQDPHELKRIMDSLGLPEFRAPPKIPLPPTQEELFFDEYS